MALELHITPEDIDQLVKDSVLKAAFGKTISEMIAKAFSGYDSPVEKQLKHYVGEIASQLIREKFADQIKAAVAENIEKTITQQMLQKTVDTAVQKMARAADDY